MYFWSSAALREISLCIHRGPPTPLSSSLIRPHVSSEGKKKQCRRWRSSKGTERDSERENRHREKEREGGKREREVSPLKHFWIKRGRSWMVATPCAWKRRDTVTKAGNYFLAITKRWERGSERKRDSFQGDFCFISSERLIPLPSSAWP